MDRSPRVQHLTRRPRLRAARLAVLSLLMLGLALPRAWSDGPASIGAQSDSGVSPAADSSPPPGRQRYVGFAVGSPYLLQQGWPDDVAGEQRRALTEERGYHEASLAHRMNGNMLRVFYSRDMLFGDELQLQPKGTYYKLPLKKKLQILKNTDKLLKETLASSEDSRDRRGHPLDYGLLDAFFHGVQRFNREQSDPRGPIRVMLSIVSKPPRAIIEAPRDSTLQYFGHPFTYQELWSTFLALDEQFMRGLARRYVTSPDAPRLADSQPLLAAIEVINEPDYHWIPDEMRIEKGNDPGSYPIGKYITEMHLQSIPTNDLMNTAFEPTGFGFKEQDIAWTDDDPDETTPVIEFRWGRKFDRYVRHLAEYHERISFALKDETAESGETLIVVSGAVTNNNIDYFMRMYRARDTVFDYVDVVGVHPYHWPKHDIWDSNFVSDEPMEGWQKVSPREFAYRFYKRFDFIEEIAKLTRVEDRESSYGLGGKKIWVTEFGVPTKKLGEFNKPIKQWVRFIYERGEEVPPGVESIVWEDIWSNFIQQVDSQYLASLNIETFLIYSLREGRPSNDVHDDDRSNLALFHADGEPRLDPSVLKRLSDLFSAFRGP